MKKTFRQTFFSWPKQKRELQAYLDEVSIHKHVWFGVNLFDQPQRRTEYALPGQLVYADLDACDPQIVDPKPSVALETSPGRFHALWRMDGRIEPSIAADYSRRIAYKYSISGADRTGWDITQLLRVPYTHNFKYPGSPEVKVVQTRQEKLDALDFEAIEVPEEFKQANGDAGDSDMPDIGSLPDPDKVIYKYTNQLKHYDILKFYETEPDEDDDWSGIMWRMINTLVEEGANEDEVFSVALNAKCNKYERDKRPLRFLWREIKKAFLVNKSIEIAVSEFTVLRAPDIAPEPATDTIISRYIEWAKQATDAVPIFHELSAFMILSTLLSSTVRLEVQYDTVVPNLWGLVLGESTLTRKTTAMRLATDVISHVDAERIAITDGSIEGVLQSLQGRPSEASVFFRDEVSGLFDAFNRREYLAGMAETLTQLYDVPRVFRRVLRKETIVLESPILVFFGGGIRDKVYGLLNDEYVFSGFLPRFLVVSGDTDLTRLRSTGPLLTEDMNERQRMYKTFNELSVIYNQERPIKVAGTTFLKKPLFKAQLTPDAWEFYQNIEKVYQQTAYDSHLSALALPTFERLSRSLLKMAVLLGAARSEPKEDRFEVSKQDITNAAYYVERWTPCSIDFIYNAGKTNDLRIMERIREGILRHPGVYRSDLMRWFHLNKRQMDLMLETLIDRGEVRLQKKGKATRFWST